MKPIPFAEQTCEIAKDQKQYQTLPAFQNDRETISRWRFSLWDLVRLCLTRTLWVRQVNFGQPLQPQWFGLESPWEKPKRAKD